MCGIIASVNLQKKPVNKRVYEQFDYQRSRGTQGFGVFDMEHNHLVRAVKEERIVNWLGKEKNQSSMLLFHHRIPTSTINTRKANHPLSTKKYFGKTEYILVHNGHISNASDLFEKHCELGIEYYSMLEDMTFTDSEALLWDFALTMEGKQKELQAKGNNAMICVQMVNGKPKKLYFGRNNNPIYMTKDDEELHLSSQGFEYAKKPKDKTEKMIDTNQLYTWYFGNHHLDKWPFTFPTNWVQRTNYNPRSLYGDDDYRGPWGDEEPKVNTWIECPDGVWRMKSRMTKKQRKEAKRWKKQQLAAEHAAQTVIQDIQPSNDKDVTLSALPAKTVSTAPQTGNSLRELLNISDEEVENTLMNYLAGCNGNFFQAHHRMQEDLQVFRAQPTSDHTLKARARLSRAIREINNDREWCKPDSISSKWERLWQQQHLVV